MANGKVRITFKSPDSVWDALEEAGITTDDLDSEVREPIEKYIEYMEYVTIEIDLDTRKAIVLPVKRG